MKQCITRQKKEELLEKKATNENSKTKSKTSRKIKGHLQMKKKLYS